MQTKDQPRLLRLRYDGSCAACKTALERSTEAWWYRAKKEIVCTSCRPLAEPGTAEVIEVSIANGDHTDLEEVVPAPLTTLGEAGASARREGEKRRQRREDRTMERHPHIGKLLLRVTEEPQAIRSWNKGAVGEEALGARLSGLANERLVVLHDRRIPGSRANIDHLVVAPGGVFVIDSKHYSGRVERRNFGNVLRPDVRLYVGSRECTKLLLGSENQSEVVRHVLSPAGFMDVPVRPVLCFIGAEWGLFASPFKLGNVLVTYPKSLYELITKDAEVETATIQDAARVLAGALPAA